MKTELIDQKRDASLGGMLLYFPSHIADEIISLSLSHIEEIRLRCGGSCSLTTSAGNLILRGRVGRREMDETVKKICGGSLYAYSDTINCGYIVMPGGARVGICGRAVTERGHVVSVYDISALTFRIPHPAPDVGGRVCSLLLGERSNGGVLIFSPPGVGKTTLLRAIIAKMGSREICRRVAVIDTRGELGCFLPKDSLVDLLSGYPRGIGIEIAARSLNPELIVCDEIGADMGEAEAIAAAHNSGVPLLASAHAGTFEELRQKYSIRALHERGIFSYYVGISRSVGEEYEYSVFRKDEF